MSLMAFNFDMIKVIQLKLVLWLVTDFIAGVKFLVEADIFLFTTHQYLELVSTLSATHKVLGTPALQG
jgi:hypothetical protein